MKYYQKKNINDMKHVKLFENYAEMKHVDPEINPINIQDYNRSKFPSVIWNELTRTLKDEVLSLEIGTNYAMDFYHYAKAFADVFSKEEIKNMGRHLSKYKTLDQLYKFFMSVMLDRFLFKEKLGRFKPFDGK